MSELQPHQDAPPCQCGRGVLVPISMHAGHETPTTIAEEEIAADWNRFECTSCGEDSRTTLAVALHAWWSYGAFQQRELDEAAHNHIQAAYTALENGALELMYAAAIVKPLPDL